MKSFKGMSLLWTVLSILIFPFLAFGAAGEGEGGEGGGKGEGEGNPLTDPSQAFQNALSKMGGEAMALAQKLFDENFRLRTARRELEAKVPPEGAVVLAGADATAWEGWKGLGQLTEVQAALGELGTLKQQAQEREAKAGIAAAAQLHKWDADVLQLALQHDGLTLRIEGEGAAQKALVVKDGKETALDAYAKEHWAKLMPALGAAAKPLGTPVRGQARPISTQGTPAEQPGQPGKREKNLARL